MIIVIIIVMIVVVIIGMIKVKQTTLRILVQVCHY